MVKRARRGRMARVKVQLKDRREFIGRFLSDVPHGGLLVEVAEPVREEDLVELDILFRDSGERHLIRGMVLWTRRPGRELHTVGVAFLASEATTREALLYSSPPLSHQDRPELARREVRYASTMKITYESASEFVIDYTRNISAGGLFIASDTPPSIGTTILFQLYPPGEPEPIDLPGQVAWLAPGQGFGVRFVDTGREARKRLDRLVRQVAIGTAPAVAAPVFEQVTS